MIAASRTTALLLASLAAAASTLDAQRVSVTAGTSAFLPLRDLGKATGPHRPSGQTIQVRSRLQPAPLLTGRVEVASPWRGITLHGAFSTTVGARAEGEVAACGILRDESVDVGEICDTRSVDGTVRLWAGGVTFARAAGAGAARLRPYLSLEAGAVQYAFEESGCADDVCALQERLLENRADPMVHFALGVVAEAGPLTVRGELGDVVSSYKSREERTRGETQNDLVLRALLSVPVG